MRAQKGIIKDVLGDSKGTVEEAKEAMRIFKAGDYEFELVGVAQGKNPEEYLACYKELEMKSVSKVAIGGLR